MQLGKIVATVSKSQLSCNKRNTFVIWELNSRLWELKSQLWVIKLQLQEKVSILSNKDLIWEIKSQLREIVTIMRNKVTVTITIREIVAIMRNKVLIWEKKVTITRNSSNN